MWLADAATVLQATVLEPAKLNEGMPKGPKTCTLAEADLPGKLSNRTSAARGDWSV